MGQALLSQMDDAVIAALWHRAFCLIQLSLHCSFPFPPFFFVILFCQEPPLWPGAGFFGGSPHQMHRL